MKKKALNLILAAGLVFAGAPGWAQPFGPNTIWGIVPQSASTAANAVLTGGQGGGMVPILGGQFAFRDLQPGRYVVVLQTATGEELARSQPVDLASGAEVEVRFGTDDAPAGAVPPGTGGGLTTTQKIALAAGAVGLATVIIITLNVASPSR